MVEIVSLDEQFLSGLLREFDDDKTIGFLLTGSHARGEATRLSDIDLFKFVTDLPKANRNPGQLRHRDGFLVSLSTVAVESKLAEMAKPETAIWVVPAFRQAKVLMDKTGTMASIQKAAETFEWHPLQSAADRYASGEVEGLSEEVHKVAGALGKGDVETMFYGATGLILGLTRSAAVKHGIMIISENSYFRQVQATIGPDSAWTSEHRIACGLDKKTSMEERAVASLRLYIETADLIGPFNDDDESIIIKETVRLAEACVNK